MRRNHNFCAPELHNDDTPNHTNTPAADFFIKAARYTAGALGHVEAIETFPRSGSFACCALHLPHAVSEVLGVKGVEAVIVRRENTGDAQ